MKELECSTLQGLMNEAYERWQSHNDWSHDAFRDSLSELEKIAVHSGNLNFQVENGGFSQWHFNQYYTPEVLQFLIELCDDLVGLNGVDVDAQSVNSVKCLLETVGERLDDYEYDKNEPCDYCQYGCDCAADEEADEDEDQWDFCSCECECIEEPYFEGLDDEFYKHNYAFMESVEAYLNHKLGVKTEA